MPLKVVESVQIQCQAEACICKCFSDGLSIGTLETLNDLKGVMVTFYAISPKLRHLGAITSEWLKLDPQSLQ